MGLYYPCSENNGADQLVTAKLICVFVFAYAKSRFSYDKAHIAKWLSEIMKQQLNVGYKYSHYQKGTTIKQDVQHRVVLVVIFFFEFLKLLLFLLCCCYI